MPQVFPRCSMQRYNPYLKSVSLHGNDARDLPLLQPLISLCFSHLSHPLGSPAHILGPQEARPQQLAHGRMGLGVFQIVDGSIAS